ncbi:Heavy metal-associated domain HMA [Arabidopsis suecica]|uniref:Heavy metal-associated domain HMA n=1 Tax=Arabidopsis suecica TaxID=45249 RepID=A0A8T2BYB2_ARASU|nr:Heavy metal-associated domain HMA [Arabidopsis suecica]
MMAGILLGFVIRRVRLVGETENLRKKEQKGVKSCITDVDDQKVLISGEFNLHKLVKALKKKTGKKIEIVMKNEKSNEDKPETSIMKVEFVIPFLCEKYEKSFGKFISKCKGVETYVMDLENKKVVVIGNFDNDELSIKLKKKMQQKIKKAERERQEWESEMMLKEAEEEKRVAEIYEEIDKDRNVYLNPITDYEKEMAKHYNMFSDENPNGCSIS